MKKLLKRLLPERVILWYHYLLAMAATILYGFPSRKMIVIGVTGTKGKTSAINFIWSCLTAGGYQTGIISTANIRIGEEESLNRYHMTMPGRFEIQRLMAAMVRKGCRFCIVETTSQGIKQYRHTGVSYDIGVFTNLSPEHLESHGGSFERYKETKGKMFAALSSRRKTLGGKDVEKVIIANVDNEHAPYFLGFDADRKVTFAMHAPADYLAEDIRETHEGVSFTVEGTPFGISIPGAFNVANALPAIIICRLFGVDDHAIALGLKGLKTIPGRMEEIRAGQDFTVFVDYAHERESVAGALAAANNIKGPGARTIILLGAEGGGRDKAKRPAMGERAGALADYVVVTDVDPYDDEPEPIREDIAVAAEKAGKTRGKDLFVVGERRLGIRKALALAHAGDIVLITGKGAEQSMVAGGKQVPWDDRIVVREELESLQARAR